MSDISSDPLRNIAPAVVPFPPKESIFLFLCDHSDQYRNRCQSPILKNHLSPNLYLDYNPFFYSLLEDLFILTISLSFTSLLNLLQPGFVSTKSSVIIINKLHYATFIDLFLILILFDLTIAKAMFDYSFLNLSSFSLQDNNPFFPFSILVDSSLSPLINLYDLSITDFQSSIIRFFFVMLIESHCFKYSLQL